MPLLFTDGDQAVGSARGQVFGYSATLPLTPMAGRSGAIQTVDGCGDQHGALGGRLPGPTGRGGQHVLAAGRVHAFV